MGPTAQGSLGPLLSDALLFQKEMPYDSNTQQFGYLFIKKKINTGDVILKLGYHWSCGLMVNVLCAGNSFPNPRLSIKSPVIKSQ